MNKKLFGIEIKKLLNHKVVKAGSWYTITEFFLKGIIFLTIPIFTRLLSTADYGIVSLYETWVKIFSIILMLGLPSSIGIAKNDFKEKYNQFTSCVTFLSLLSLVGFGALFIVFKDFFKKLTGLPEILFYFMIIQAYFMGIIEFLISKLRFEYKYKNVSIINAFIVILGIFFSIFLILYVFNQKKFFGAIIGKGSLIIIYGVFTIFYIFAKGKEYINFKYWNYSFMLGVPIIFHSLSHIINAQFDRILINRFLDSASTGLYSFAYNIGMIVSVFLGSLNKAWVPWFYEKMCEEKFCDIKKKSIYYRDFFTILYMVILIFSPEIIRLVAHEDYWEAFYILPWIFMAYFFQFMYTLEVNVEFFLKKNKLIALGTVLTAFINVILNVLFIPVYGYAAAAITTVISYFFLFLFHFFITTVILKKNLFGFKFHLISIINVIFITIAFLILKNTLIYRIIFMMLCIIFYYFTLKSSLAKSD